MSRPVARINLLLFSIGSLRFGIDAEEAEGLTAYDGKPDKDLFWFHEELQFGGASPVYRMPTVITLKATGEDPFRIIIDAMEEITEFAWSDIRPFPPLIEPFALRIGMWGILPRDNKTVLLVELRRLWKQKRSAPSRIDGNVVPSVMDKENL